MVDSTQPIIEDPNILIVVVEREMSTSPHPKGHYCTQKGHVHILTVSEESTKNDILGVVLRKKEIKIRRFETAQTRFALDNKVACVGLHGRMKIGPKGTSSKGFTVLDTLEDTVGIFADFMMTGVKHDGTMNNRAPGITSRFECLGGILQHVVGGHAILYSIMKLTAFSRKLVLEFNKDKRRHGRIQGKGGHFQGACSS